MLLVLGETDEICDMTQRAQRSWDDPGMGTSLLLCWDPRRTWRQAGGLDKSHGKAA